MEFCMMKRYIGSLLLILLISVTGCKKNSTLKNKVPEKVVKQESEVQTSLTTQKNKNLLEADEFSKSLTGKKISLSSDNDDNQEKQNISLKGLFQVDPVGNDAFDNEKFSENKAPFNSLTESLLSRHRYSWLPKWHYENGGSVLIPDIVLSRDSSLLGLLETVSLPSGGKGTLLILIDTYQWRIVRIYFYKERIFTKLLFIGRGKRMLLAEKLNSRQGLQGKLHIVNLKSGRISKASYAFQGELEAIDLSLKSKKAFLKIKNNEEIVILNIPALTKESVCKTELKNAMLKTGFDNVVLIGKEKIKIYNSNMKHINNEYTNSLQEIPTEFAFTGNDSSEFAYGVYMKKTIFFKAGKLKVLTEHAGRVITALPEFHLLVFSDMYKNKIRFINSRDFAEDKPIIPGKIPPKTLAGARFLTYMKKRHQFIVLDTHGNLCLYWKGGRKTKNWKKHIIFKAEK
jgi:hypothetical protein